MKISIKSTNRIAMREKEITVKLKIWGIVQGVGFRPFVAKLSDHMGMRGEVRNIGGLVDIVLTDTRKRIDQFLTALQEEKPDPAEIVHIREEILEKRSFEKFTILDSDDGDDEAAMIPADLSICPECLEELFQEDNVRYRHPFISCMACGPRYTIIDQIPYDRCNTTMTDFPMCELCGKEYADRRDRRYHAQTISCHDCGPRLLYRLQEKSLKPYLADINQKELFTGGKHAEEAIALAAKLIQEEEVIALKGVGGYHLMCNPFSDKAVSTLRQIKNREEKPFAVLFFDVDQILKFCKANETEQRLLTSSARPILLLEARKEEEWQCLLENLPQNSSFKELKKSRLIGCFLPSMGAYYLLLEAVGHPLIATSANLSDSPIIKEDAEMFQLMEKQPLIAASFYNERRINVRIDDSVARVIDGQPQMIRRSKGYAPVPLYVQTADGNRGNRGFHSTDRQLTKSDMIFAAGGQLKSSFCLSKGNFAYVSQYFGDLDSDENRRIYAENVYRMEKFFRIRPTLALCDLHPSYGTTDFTKEYAKDRGIPLLSVQHHHAHVASVVAEHGIKGAVIGIAFDGTGYGTNGTIWGGEFLLCEGSGFTRVAHLPEIKMLGGDASMKEGWKSAMCYLYDAEHGVEEFPKESGEIRLDLSEYMAFSDLKEHANWKLVSAALEHDVNCIRSSSMGRLFDGVAAMLCIETVNHYEGECAILLENAAAQGLAHPGKSRRNDLALRFHMDVADMIVRECNGLRKRYGTSQVALTGGVFQNKILMERALLLLRKAGFQVYYNISVSPNDGGISLGQTYIGMNHLLEKEREG